MGKYNFDGYNKIRALEERMKQLEIQNQKLVADNEKLKEKIESKEHIKRPRNVKDVIPDKQYEFLFGYDVDEKTGAVIKADTVYQRSNNFTNFFRYISQTMKPNSRKANDKYVVTSTAMNRFDETEWQIVSEVLKGVCGYLTMGKQLIVEHSRGNEYDVKKI